MSRAGRVNSQRPFRLCRMCSGLLERVNGAAPRWAAHRSSTCGRGSIGSREGVNRGSTGGRQGVNRGSTGGQERIGVVPPFAAPPGRCHRSHTPGR
eukprot:233548-Prorocentrum_minimum.AAC.1